MKKLLFSIIALAISLTMYSCKDTTGPDDTATVTLRSELKNSTAKVSTTLFNSGIASSDIDSIQVKKIRILITEIKFHSTTESDVQKDQLFKSGPLLFVVDSTGSKLEIASGTLPSGAYNKMKFEMNQNILDQELLGSISFECLLKSTDLDFLDQLNSLNLVNIYLCIYINLYISINI
jgi:hypothetical protein